MRTQIMAGILARLSELDKAEVDYAVNAPRFSYRELYRLVESVSIRHGVKVRKYHGDNDWNAFFEYLQSAYAHDCDTDGWVVLDNGECDGGYFDNPLDWQTVVQVSKEAAGLLLSHTCETVFYNECTCEYVWAIPFFNNNWNVVSACMF